ncbi:hypothetical protein BJV78DRAFT_1284257 [Lactifluus subvellereus]|nr:hypothetical protein BJV78DRAFT_1284257 [Lactifluus subvellereus]
MNGVVDGGTGSYTLADVGVAEMLKHSPAFPLNIAYNGERPMSAEDEESALLALRHHDCVRLIDISESGSQTLFAVMDKPFPMLEGLRLAFSRLIFYSQLPQTFAAPYLRHLELVRVGYGVISKLYLLASITGPVTLTLDDILASPFLPVVTVEYLILSLSLMPQLESLHLKFAVLTSSDRFRSERSAPLPESASPATLFPQSSFPLSFLSELLVAAEELRFPVASVKFMDRGDDPPESSIYMAGSEQTLGLSPENAPFRISLRSPPLDKQAVLVGQVCAALAPMLSTVERLHINCSATRWQERCLPPENQRATWRNLLRPFRNVEKLCVDDTLVEDLCLALCPGDEPLMEMEILPELSQLTWPDSARVDNAFDDGLSLLGRPPDGS